MAPFSYHTPIWDNVTADPSNLGVLPELDPATGVPIPYGVIRPVQELHTDAEWDNVLINEEPLPRGNLLSAHAFLRQCIWEGTNVDQNYPDSEKELYKKDMNHDHLAMECFLGQKTYQEKLAALHRYQNTKALWARIFTRECIQMLHMHYFLCKHHHELTDAQFDRYRQLYYSHRMLADSYGSLMLLMIKEMHFKLLKENLWSEDQYVFGTMNNFFTRYNGLLDAADGSPSDKIPTIPSGNTDSIGFL